MNNEAARIQPGRTRPLIDHGLRAEETDAPLERTGALGALTPGCAPRPTLYTFPRTDDGLTRVGWMEEHMNATTIEIFHNTSGTGPFGYQPWHPVTEVFTFTLPADELTDVHAVAERAFQVGNGSDRLSDTYYRLARRSMGAGDLVRLNGLVWLSCNLAGFSLLPYWPLATNNTHPGEADITAARHVTSVWPAVNRYSADVDWLRRLIIAEAADEIPALLAELPAVRAAARECSQTATRNVEEMFRETLTIRRIEAIRMHSLGGVQ